jgi:hypothetical protein
MFLAAVINAYEDSLKQYQDTDAGNAGVGAPEWRSPFPFNSSQNATGIDPSRAASAHR